MARWCSYRWKVFPTPTRVAQPTLASRKPYRRTQNRGSTSVLSTLPAGGSGSTRRVPRAHPLPTRTLPLTPQVPGWTMGVSLAKAEKHCLLTCRTRRYPVSSLAFTRPTSLSFVSLYIHSVASARSSLDQATVPLITLKMARSMGRELAPHLVAEIQVRAVHVVLYSSTSNCDLRSPYIGMEKGHGFLPGQGPRLFLEGCPARKGWIPS